MSGAVVVQWSGREVRALRLARRMSLRDFAEHLGVSDRMVSKWEAGRECIHPRPVNQAALDESLRRTEPHERERFNAALRLERPCRCSSASLRPVLTEGVEVIDNVFGRKSAG